MIHVHRRTVVIGLVVLIVVLAGITSLAVTHAFPYRASGPDTTTPVVVQGGQPARVGTTETTDEGLSVTLLQIDKRGTRWLFHFQIKNMAQAALTVRGTSDVHQFVLVGVIQTPPYHVEVQLGSPSASEQIASYADLVTTLPSGGAAQGWLAVDTAKLGTTPVQLLYRYRAVPSLGCTDPADQSTCQTDTLYSALDWHLP
jgi:hypothetical protein